MELGPAQDRGDGTCEKHGVEQDESADGGVRVLAQDHERHEPHSRAPQVELFCGPVGHWNADGTEQGVELAHQSVVDFLGVGFSRLKFERPIIPGDVARETDKQLSQRRLGPCQHVENVPPGLSAVAYVDVEVIFVLQVVGTKLAEAVPQEQMLATRCQIIATPERNILSFIPCHDIGEADLVESCEEGECGKDQGRDDPFPLVEGL